MNAGAGTAAAQLAPTGELRVAINLGNTILVQGTAGDARGVTMDLSRELARRLNVPVRHVFFATPLAVTDAMRAGAGLDLVFLADEPARAEVIDFTPPYVLIEGVYAARGDSALRDAAEADRAGVRIGVNRGSAYDLFLTRSLRHATLVREESGYAAFAEGRADLVGGVRQMVEADIAALAGARLLNGRFMEIRQAIGTAKGRPAGFAYLRDFVAEMLRSGFVAESLRRSGQDVAAAAPPVS